MQEKKERRKGGWALFAGEILAQGLGIISLEVEVPCSCLGEGAWQRLKEKRSALGERGVCCVTARQPY